MSENDYYRSIDGWRGVFAFVIVCYHFWWQKTEVFLNGYLAVDFFFILSGFLWMNSEKKNGYDCWTYCLKSLKRYFPIIGIYYLLYGTVLAICNSLNPIREKGIHLLYEILFMHLIGISPEAYIASYLWYIPVMIFILSVFSGFYVINCEVFEETILPICAIAGITHLYATYGGLADFRSVFKMDFFIKGVYRGIADISLGCILFILLPRLQSMLQNLSKLLVFLIEIFSLFFLIVIIFSTPEKSAEVLVLPISSVIIVNSVCNVGMMSKIGG